MNPFFEEFFRSYQNEKNTNRLLPPKSKIISEIKQEIKSQTEYLDELTDGKQYKVIYEQELENIKYFLVDYIKIRIEKIQKDFYIDETFMSENEAIFHKKLVNRFKDLDIYVNSENKELDHEYVGFIAQEDIGNVMIEGNSVDISCGDFFVVKFSEIENLLKDRKIILV